MNPPSLEAKERTNPVHVLRAHLEELHGEKEKKRKEKSGKKKKKNKQNTTLVPDHSFMKSKLGTLVRCDLSTGVSTGLSLVNSSSMLEVSAAPLTLGFQGTGIFFASSFKIVGERGGIRDSDSEVKREERDESLPP